MPNNSTAALVTNTLKIPNNSTRSPVTKIVVVLDEFVESRVTKIIVGYKKTPLGWQSQKKVYVPKNQRL